MKTQLLSGIICQICNCFWRIFAVSGYFQIGLGCFLLLPKSEGPKLCVHSCTWLIGSGGFHKLLRSISFWICIPGSNFYSLLSTNKGELLVIFCTTYVLWQILQGWPFRLVESTCVLSEIQLTKHFIELVFVETNELVRGNSNAILIGKPSVSTR